MSRSMELQAFGIILVVLGFILTIVGMIVVMLGSMTKGKVKGGGVVMIGPIPLIFGTEGKWAFLAAVMALVLMLLSLLLFRWWT